MWSLVPYIGAVVVIWLTYRIHRWRNLRFSRGKLPPGSMGLPLLGETFSFFASTTSLDIAPFIKQRMERYGDIFRTNVMGMPIIISTDAEFSNFIFQQEGRLFQLWYPGSLTKIYDSKTKVALYGSIHKCIRAHTMSIFGPEGVRKGLLFDMEHACCEALRSWATLNSSIELKGSFASMIFALTAKKLINYGPKEGSEDLRKCFLGFLEGIMAFPLYIPGTAFHRSIKCYKKTMKVLKSMLDERCAAAETEARKGDFLDAMAAEIRKEDAVMTEKIALTTVFIVIFASFEITSLSLAFVLKLLTDHPKVLEQLTKEHDQIARNLENQGSGITWNDYKSMAYTSQVINESLRLGNIAPMIFRKSMSDVCFKGYTIPADSMVMVYTPALHLDPAIYPDPLSFKPERWEGQETKAGSKHLMIFGGGSRFCAGAEFSKLFMSIFLHHLVTKYRWMTVKGGEVVRGPLLKFPNGFHIELHEKKKAGAHS